ncbi:unnamed protein product [Adineta steineri]|uniref:PLAT domain-containing protein n=1 Tax=Adineta steineri TaxID=433720 RepID=A0A814WGM6_9BILA|nr:unnamed protein product [Adineta steineri]
MKLKFQHAGTTQHGWIILEGNKKRSEKFHMKNTPHQKILRGGQTDTFTFECHKERPEYPLKTYEGREAMWHVAHVTVTDPSTGVKFEFPVRKRIDINNEGDVSHAGTDANVSIILYGTLGDTGIRKLKQKGDLTKLHIEHDNDMISPDWFLDKVEVINIDTNETIAFLCNRWLGKNYDDHKLQQDVLPIKIS